LLVRLLRTYMLPYRRWILVVVVLQLVQSLATLYLPTLNAAIIDKGVVTGNTGYITSRGALMLAITVGQVACSIGAVYFGAHTATSTGHDMRAAVFHRVQDFSAREVAHFGTPSLITRTTNDVQQVQLLTFMSLNLAVSAPIMGIGSILMALNQDVPLSSLLVVLIPVLAAVIALIVSRMRPLFRLVQQRIDRVNQVLREQISGVRVIRAFVKDTAERERFEVINSQLFTVTLGTGRLMAFMFPSVMLAVNVASVATLWFGGHLVGDGSMQIGSLTAFLTYLVQVLMAVMMATFMFLMIPRAEASAERIQEVLSTEPTVRDPESRRGVAHELGPIKGARSPVQPNGAEVRGRAEAARGAGRTDVARGASPADVARGASPADVARKAGRAKAGQPSGAVAPSTLTESSEPHRANGGSLGPGRGRVRVELLGAGFRYPGAQEPVLRQIDMVALPGEVTAVIGSTGSGKTTLVNLVARLFDATEGSVSLGGANVRDLDAATLASLIGLVPQRPYLFSGTIASNLRYGLTDATEDQMWEALRTAQAADFVKAMPGQLEALIAQGGTNVSGGQRQRLAIARALVHRPAVYLFDDSFSALDYSTDAALRRALGRETADATVVIVAQRVSTIRHADRIVVLDRGEVVGTGTHDVLMGYSDTYREIVLSQLTAEEAA